MGILGRVLQPEKASGAKALRQKHSWVVQGHWLEMGNRHPGRQGQRGNEVQDICALLQATVRGWTFILGDIGTPTGF